MSDSSEAWLLTLQRLRREQTTAEAAVARKTQEHQATADAWASRVVRPAFATLAQHFNQGSDTRSLVVRPDLPQESLSRGQSRGIGVVSGSPRERPQGDYHQVGVEVVREGRREFVYYLLISADEAGIAVRKVVTDADAEALAAAREHGAMIADGTDSLLATVDLRPALARALADRPVVSSLTWQDAPPVVDLADTGLHHLSAGWCGCSRGAAAPWPARP